MSSILADDAAATSWEAALQPLESADSPESVRVRGKTERHGLEGSVERETTTVASGDGGGDDDVFGDSADGGAFHASPNKRRVAKKKSAYLVREGNVQHTRIHGSSNSHGSISHGSNSHGSISHGSNSNSSLDSHLGSGDDVLHPEATDNLVAASENSQSAVGGSTMVAFELFDKQQMQRFFQRLWVMIMLAGIYVVANLSQVAYCSQDSFYEAGFEQHVVSECLSPTMDGSFGNSTAKDIWAKCCQPYGADVNVNDHHESAACFSRWTLPPNSSATSWTPNSTEQLVFDSESFNKCCAVDLQQVRVERQWQP